MEHVELTEKIIGAAIKVRAELGPGLLEPVYETCPAQELRRAALEVERQKIVPARYDYLVFGEGFRIDLLVNDAVTIELKPVAALPPIHQAQLLTYLRLAGKPVGLLTNFKVKLLKDGLKRFVL